jgi:DNA repair exonuclease SbcCD ATPase subunit
MSKKLTIAALLILSLVMISQAASMAAEKEVDEKGDIEIYKLRDSIKKLEHALEDNPGSEKAKARKADLEKLKAKLERLTAESRKAQKPEGEFPEIETAIKKAKGQLAELRKAAEAMQERGESPEKLEELKQRIAKKESELQELTALLEQRRAKRKQLEDKETEIRKVKEAIQELERALEQNPDSEKAEDWKAALKEHRAKLERMMAEFRKAQEPRRRTPKGRLLTGWVVRGNENEITIKTMETGKTMMLRVPQRRREDGRMVKNAALARMARELRGEQLILVRYTEGEKKGVYLLQQVRTISLEREENQRAKIVRRLESLERRLGRIEEGLKQLLGRERPQRRRSRRDTE